MNHSHSKRKCKMFFKIYHSIRNGMHLPIIIGMLFEIINFIQMLGVIYKPMGDEEASYNKVYSIVMNYAMIEPLIEAVYNGAIIMLSISLALCLLYFIGLLCARLLKRQFKSKKFLLVLHALKLVNYLLVYVFYIPIMLGIASSFLCTGQTMKANSLIVCHSSKHIVLICLNVVLLGAITTIMVFISLYGSDSQLNVSNIFARPDNNVEIDRTVYTAIITVLSIVLKNHWVFELINSIFLSKLFTSYLSHLHYYNRSMSITYGCNIFALTWYEINVLCIISTKLIKVNHQLLCYFYSCIPICIICFFYYQYKTSSIIFSSFDSLKKSLLDTEIYITQIYYMSLFTKQPTYMVKLHCYVSNHIKTCNSRICPLKNGIHYDPTKSEFSGNIMKDFPISRVCCLIIREQLKNVKIIHQRRPKYYLLISQLYLFTYNVNQCTIDLKNISAENTTCQQSYSMYNISKELKKTLISFTSNSLKIESIDLYIPIKFDNIFQSLVHEVEKIVEDQIEFWSLFDSLYTDMNVIKAKSFKLLQQSQKISILWRKLYVINPNEYKSLEYYSLYCKYVNTDSKEAQFYHSKSKTALLNNMSNKRTSALDSLFSSDSVSVIMSGMPENRCNITSINDKIEAIFGYKREEIIGKNVNTLLPFNIAQLHNQSIDNFMESGGSKFLWRENILPALHKNGDIFMANVVVNYVSNINDGICFASLIKKYQKVQTIALTYPNGIIIGTTSAFNELFLIDKEKISKSLYAIQQISPDLQGLSMNDQYSGIKGNYIVNLYENILENNIELKENISEKSIALMFEREPSEATHKMEIEIKDYQLYFNKLHFKIVILKSKVDTCEEGENEFNQVLDIPKSIENIQILCKHPNKKGTMESKNNTSIDDSALNMNNMENAGEYKEYPDSTSSPIKKKDDKFETGSAASTGLPSQMQLKRMLHNIREMIMTKEKSTIIKMLNSLSLVAFIFMFISSVCTYFINYSLKLAIKSSFASDTNYWGMMELLPFIYYSVFANVNIHSQAQFINQTARADDYRIYGHVNFTESLNYSDWLQLMLSNYPTDLNNHVNALYVDGFMSQMLTLNYNGHDNIDLSTISLDFSNALLSYVAHSKTASVQNKTVDDTSVMFILNNTYPNLIYHLLDESLNVRARNYKKINKCKTQLIILLSTTNIIIVLWLLSLQSILVKTRGKNSAIINLFLEIPLSMIKKQMNKINEYKTNLKRKKPKFEKTLNQMQTQNIVPDVSEDEEAMLSVNNGERPIRKRKGIIIIPIKKYYCKLVAQFIAVILLLQIFFITSISVFTTQINAILLHFNDYDSISQKKESNSRLLYEMFWTLATNDDIDVNGDDSVDNFMKLISDALANENKRLLEYQRVVKKVHSNKVIRSILFSNGSCEQLMGNTSLRSNCVEMTGNLTSIGIHSVNCYYSKVLSDLMLYYSTSMTPERAFAVINGYEFQLLERLNSALLIPSLNLCLTILLDDTNYIASNILKINAILIGLILVIIILTYNLLWKKLSKNLQKEIWINRTLFLVLPMDIIINIKKIKDYFMSTSSSLSQ